MPSHTIPRCCASHSDWAQLSEHLVADFTNAHAGDVLAELSRARQALDFVGLPASEQLEVAELMTRHEMLVRAGKISAAVRLDPELHPRRAKEPESASSAPTG
ncbi:MAG TPA: hypothetical protein VG708_12190 [Mycobacteriales bacterium]|nr:hypothetical protein [Mycobacteriales bacterium]